MGYQQRITIEAGKRSGRPCIRGLRISVYDVLEQLAAGLSHQEILEDFPELEEADITACLAFAADREHRLVAIGEQWRCCSTRTCRGVSCPFWKRIIPAAPKWRWWDWGKPRMRKSGATPETTATASVTKDADFYDLSLLRGAPPKVIWLKSGNLTKSAITHPLIANREYVEAKLAEAETTCVELY